MAIRSETRTIHTIIIPLPDDVLARIDSGDEVEFTFTSSQSYGRVPRPTRMAWSTLSYLMGWNR